jgi:trehalose/maltose hydrolase-like predicted phosphorylase
MLFYLLSADELGELFKRLGYTFDSNMIPRNIEYYLKRTSHGSTLSRVVHSWVLARSRREVSWHLFQDALESDVSDIQGGTTHEGIHLGAMAGTVDIIQRAYSGLETRGDVLRFNPVLPKGLASVEFEIRYRGHWLNVRITRDALRVTSRQHLVGPIQIALDGTTHVLAPGNTLQLSLSSR